MLHPDCHHSHPPPNRLRNTNSKLLYWFIGFDTCSALPPLSKKTVRESPSLLVLRSLSRNTWSCSAQCLPWTPIFLFTVSLTMLGSPQIMVISFAGRIMPTCWPVLLKEKSLWCPSKPEGLEPSWTSLTSWIFPLVLWNTAPRRFCWSETLATKTPCSTSKLAGMHSCNPGFWSVTANSGWHK